MATITESSKGKTLELTPAERIELAGKVRAALDRLGLTIAAAAAATTLSTATIRMRLRDSGDGPGTRIALWTWVALCDGLELDPVEVAELFGVTIEQADLSTATHALAVRRRRMGGEGGAKVPSRPRPTPTPATDGERADLTRMLEAAVERRLNEVIESRLDEVIGRKLEELSA